MFLWNMYLLDPPLGRRKQQTRHSVRSDANAEIDFDTESLIATSHVCEGVNGTWFSGHPQKREISILNVPSPKHIGYIRVMLWTVLEG